MDARRAYLVERLNSGGWQVVASKSTPDAAREEFQRLCLECPAWTLRWVTVEAYRGGLTG